MNTAATATTSAARLPLVPPGLPFHAPVPRASIAPSLRVHCIRSFAVKPTPPGRPMLSRVRPSLAGVLAVVLLHAPILAQSNNDQTPAQTTAAAPRRDGLITAADIKAWNSFRG